VVWFWNISKTRFQKKIGKSKGQRGFGVRRGKKNHSGKKNFRLENRGTRQDVSSGQKENGSIDNPRKKNVRGRGNGGLEDFFLVSQKGPENPSD